MNESIIAGAETEEEKTRLLIDNIPNSFLIDLLSALILSMTPLEVYCAGWDFLYVWNMDNIQITDIYGTDSFLTNIKADITDYLDSKK